MRLPALSKKGKIIAAASVLAAAALIIGLSVGLTNKSNGSSASTSGENAAAAIDTNTGNTVSGTPEATLNTDNNILSVTPTPTTTPPLSTGATVTVSPTGVTGTSSTTAMPVGGSVSDSSIYCADSTLKCGRFKLCCGGSYDACVYNPPDYNGTCQTCPTEFCGVQRLCCGSNQHCEIPHPDGKPSGRNLRSQSPRTQNRMLWEGKCVDNAAPTPAVTDTPTPSPTDVTPVLTFTALVKSLNLSGVSVTDYFLIRSTFASILGIDIARVIITEVNGSPAIMTQRKRRLDGTGSLPFNISILGLVDQNETQTALNNASNIMSTFTATANMFMFSFGTEIVGSNLTATNIFYTTADYVKNESNVCFAGSLFNAIGVCAIPVEDMGGCPPELPFVNNVIDVCYTSCPSGMEYNMDLNRCYVPCVAPLMYNSLRDKCYDPTVCIGGQVYDDVTDGCECVGAREWNDAQNMCVLPPLIPIVCASPRRLDGGVCGCPCGAAYDGISNECAVYGDVCTEKVCPAGEIYFEKLGMCETVKVCPADGASLLETAFDGAWNKCYDPNMCVAPMVYDMDTGACACPCGRAAGPDNTCSVYGGYACPPIDGCTAPKIYSPVQADCIDPCVAPLVYYNEVRDECYAPCEGPKSEYNDYTAQCECPAGSKWFEVLNKCDTPAVCAIEEHYNPILNVCFTDCPETQPLYNQVADECVPACPAGELYNGVQDTCYMPCVAPKMYDMYASEDVCYDAADCVAPNTLNMVANQCELVEACPPVGFPKMTSYNAVRNMCYQPCEEGEQFNAMLNVCYDPDMCMEPLMYLPLTGSCGCPCDKAYDKLDNTCSVYGDECLEHDGI